MIARIFLIVTLVVFGGLFTGPAAAEWSHDPLENNPICTTGSSFSPRVVSDGAGGAIFVWMDARTYGNSWDIYAQRVDAHGQMLWPVDGVAVCAATNQQSMPQIARDGAGGVIITWTDERISGDFDIYAQRVDPDGNMLWTADGVMVCGAPEFQQHPAVVSDGAGGVIIAWEDYRWLNRDIWAQRLDADGNPLWAADGEMVCVEQGHQKQVQVVSDGTGGAICSWLDLRNGSDNGYIYAQLMGADGFPDWTPDGMAISTAADMATSPQMDSDGQGGAVILWVDANQSSGSDLFAQRVDAVGAMLWAVNGVTVCEAQSWQFYYPRIFSNGAGGATICWHERETEDNGNISAQRLDGSGQLQWGTEGEVVCDVLSYTHRVELVDDGLDGAIITWKDARSVDEAIYAQRIDSGGSSLWSNNGVAVCIADHLQDYPQLVSDGAGGMIATWVDHRNDAEDIYAQQVGADGLLGGPENQPPVALADVTPTSGTVPLTVSFDAGDSYDPEGMPLAYDWDFGDPNSPSNTSDQENPTHVYLNPGTYTAWLTVSDGDLTDSAPVTVQVLRALSAEMMCWPQIGILPFDCQVTGSLNNEYANYHRRLAATVTVDLPNGEHFTDYKRGYTNLAPATSHQFSWTEHLTSNAMVGAIEAHLSVQDVTPTPYNQPPYPPSGAMVSESCVVDVLAE